MKSWADYTFAANGTVSSGHGVVADAYGRTRDMRPAVIGRAYASGQNQGRYSLTGDLLTLRTPDGTVTQETLLTYPQYAGREQPGMLFIGERALLGK